MKYDIKDSYKQLIVDTGVEMIEKKITVGTWGNISVRDPETDLIYISPSGMDYTKTQTKHVVVMDLDLNIVDGAAEPSIEKHMHIAVYKARKDVNAVIHTHPVYSTAFGVAEQNMIGVSEDFIQIVGSEIKVAKPYELPGTAALGEVAASALGTNNAVLLPGHGALVVGVDMKMALKVSMVLEKNAQIYLFAKLLAGDGHIRKFEQTEVESMQDFAKNHYGKKNKDL